VAHVDDPPRLDDSRIIYTTESKNSTDTPSERYAVASDTNSVRRPVYPQQTHKCADRTGLKSSIFRCSFNVSQVFQRWGNFFLLKLPFLSRYALMWWSSRCRSLYWVPQNSRYSLVGRFWVVIKISGKNVKKLQSSFL
jgi:hypothetical protein